MPDCELAREHEIPYETMAASPRNNKQPVGTLSTGTIDREMTAPCNNAVISAEAGAVNRVLFVKSETSYILQYITPSARLCLEHVDRDAERRAVQLRQPRLVETPFPGADPDAEPPPNTKQSSLVTSHQLECGPMPNVMAALPNIGGALYGSSVIPFLVPRRKVWLTPAAGVP